MAFAGFPRDTIYTPAPAQLFGSLLEEIHDLAELKVTLRGLGLLHQKRPRGGKSLRAVALDEFLSDATLLRAIGGETGAANPGPEPDDASLSAQTPADEIRRGLRLAVRRGVFLAHEAGPGKVYFVLNNDAGRRIIARMKQSGGEPDDAGRDSPGFSADEAPPSPQARPNIFALYEDTIGMLSPIVAERLKEAEERYPPSWIVEAFEIAALENKRSWGYIDAILKRWGSEGKGGRSLPRNSGERENPESGAGMLGGSHDHGKPWRHSPQNQRQKYIQDYERYRRRAASRTRPR